MALSIKIFKYLGKWLFSNYKNVLNHTYMSHVFWYIQYHLSYIERIDKIFCKMEFLKVNMFFIMFKMKQEQAFFGKVIISSFLINNL